MSGNKGHDEENATSAPTAALRPFIPFIILLMFSYTKDDIEVFMMYFLFSQTDYGCDFNEAFGTYLYINAAVQIFAQPVWARLSDRYSKYSTVLLWGALLGESIIEVFMFAIPGHNYGVILTLCLLRSVVHTENTIAMWKVFKIKLEFAHFHDSNAHDKIINNIGMWGIVGEVALDVYIFSSGYLLCYLGYSYTVVMVFVYFMTTAPSFLVWFIAYFWFTPEYLEDPSHGDHRKREHFSRSIQMNTLDEIEPNKFTEQTSSQSITQKFLSSRFCHFKAISVDKIEANEVKAQQGFLGTLRYFKEGIKHIYNNTVCATGLIHAFFVCLFWKLMSGAEPLNLAASNINSEIIPTLDNLCAGEFTNLFYQYAWNNVFYVIGATCYILILIRTPPFVFFRWFWPCIGVFFAVCITPLIFDVPYAIQVLLAATVGVFPWYLYRYDEYLCTATVDSEYVGVLQALVGYIRYITPAVPGLFLAFGLVNVVFLCAYLVLFVSIIYSLYSAFNHKAELQAISAHDKNDEPSIFTRILRKCGIKVCN